MTDLESYVLSNQTVRVNTEPNGMLCLQKIIAWRGTLLYVKNVRGDNERQMYLVDLYHRRWRTDDQSVWIPGSWHHDGSFTNHGLLLDANGSDIVLYWPIGQVDEATHAYITNKSRSQAWAYQTRVGKSDFLEFGISEKLRNVE